MSDGTGLADALLGLDGFRVLAVSETPAELVVEVETTAEVVGWGECGTRAEAHERMAVEIRDVACFARREPVPVRRRVQNETLFHRGRKHDPLYRIRKLLLAGAERLDERGHDRMLLGLRVGDPHDEVLGAWLAKESVHDLYLTDDPDEAATLIDKAIAGCGEDEVEEIRSLGRTPAAWRTEILAHHTTGSSNGPTEGLNLCVKQIKRCGFGFRRFKHYRLRVLLHAGGVTWPTRPSPPRIRTRAPYSNA